MLSIHRPNDGLKCQCVYYVFSLLLRVIRSKKDAADSDLPIKK